MRASPLSFRDVIAYIHSQQDPDQDVLFHGNMWAVVDSDHAFESFRCGSVVGYVAHTFHILDLEVGIVRPAYSLQFVEHRTSVYPHGCPVNMQQSFPLRLPKPYADGAILFPRASS
jgi:hypothetical protein